jgi:hypothetical protein
MGYHTKAIEKGVLGTSSKIREELEELQDGELQGIKILVHCEMADLYGALRALAITYGLTMVDLCAMCDATESAFKDGTRK